VVLVEGGQVIQVSGGGSGAPLVIAQDFLDVPTGVAPSSSFIPTGMTAANYEGEGGAGGYLAVALTNPGSVANMGTPAGARMFIDGVEIANYRYLIQAPCAVAARAVGWPFPDIWILGVQIGSAAVQALAIGTPLALSVVVNGVASNTNDLRGNPIQIVLTQAPIVYIDENNGSESNPGTFASPKQYAQSGASGNNMLGVLASNLTVSGGKSSGAQAGIMCVVRNSGTWAHATTGPNSTAWVQGQRVTGCAPTIIAPGGVAGVNVGSLKICGYPGPIGGNAPELPEYTGSAFYFGQDSADAGESGSSAGITNPYDGSAGMNHYMQFSNIRVAPGTNTIASWLFNIDNSAHYFRSFNCESTWPFTADMRAGGAAGDGVGVRIFLPYIHDIGGASMTHGFYADAEAGYCWDWEVAFGFVYNCFGGSSFQSYAAGYGGSGPDLQGHTSNGAIVVHHMCIDGKPADTTNKYGIYWSDATGGAVGAENVAAYNLLANAGVANFGWNTEEKAYCYNYNNTLYATNSVYGMMYNNSTPGTGSLMVVQNNLLVLGAGRVNSSTPFWDQGAGGTFTQNYNRCYDPEGHQTSPLSGTGNSYGDPLIVTDWTDFELTSSSPCLGAGSNSGLPIIFAYDYMLNPVPRAGQSVVQVGAFA
jgi:hypothetical protein